MLIRSIALLAILATPAFAEAGGNGKGNGRQDNGYPNPPGTYNNDNKGPNGENNCAGGGCGVDGAYHAKGIGWPGQGDGRGTK